MRPRELLDGTPVAIGILLLLQLLPLLLPPLQLRLQLLPGLRVCLVACHASAAAAAAAVAAAASTLLFVLQSHVGWISIFSDGSLGRGHQQQ